MMREKYESLPLATLKDLARAREIPGISGMKKAELIERMLEEDIRDKERSANTGDKDKQEIHDIDKLDRLWRTDSDLSGVRIIFRGRMTSMCRRPRSADLI